MAAPILSLTDSTNTPLQILSFGIVDAGSQSGGIPIRVWNNFSNAAQISDALNTTITTMTYNGLFSGDSVANGNEIVTNQIIGVQCQTAGDTNYYQIGGPSNRPIGDSPISSSPTGGYEIRSANYAGCLVQATVPSSASPGNINFLLRVAYQYN
jgi:hypothetical protein